MQFLLLSAYSIRSGDRLSCTNFSGIVHYFFTAWTPYFCVASNKNKANAYEILCMLQKHWVGHRTGFANQSVPLLTFMLLTSELLQLLPHALFKKSEYFYSSLPLQFFFFHQCAAADKKSTLLNCGNKLQPVHWQVVGQPH